MNTIRKNTVREARAAIAQITAELRWFDWVQSSKPRSRWRWIVYRLRHRLRMFHDSQRGYK